MNRTYICIDLKSFYASVECRERNLDPLSTNLVVANEKMTEKTICLAVTPSLKEYGISSRARLYEVIQKVKEVNNNRRQKTKGYKFIGKSYDDRKLKQNINLEVDYIIAPPQMKKYIKYSTDIYKIYLKYIAFEDIYVYSIDEVFCDVTSYLNYYKITARELVTKIIKDVYETTKITATAGIGTNIYLAKIAMDIVAKNIKPNDFGVRIAYLDETSYRKKLWSHRPLTSFWRIGPGYAKKLEANNIYTMGDVARLSLDDEDYLYHLFGINAELLIDHAWGYEPCTIKDIKAYKPKNESISSGQVLHHPYDYNKTIIVIKEMMELLSLELVDKCLVTDQIVLIINYDISNLTDKNIKKTYNGIITKDNYGRNIPKHSRGTINLDNKTASTKILVENVLILFNRIINKNLLVRKINLVVNNVTDVKIKNENNLYEQINMFANKDLRIKEQKENNLQKQIITIKNKYGKNSILKGMNFQEGANTIERNKEIGGHKG